MRTLAYKSFPFSASHGPESSTIILLAEITAGIIQLVDRMSVYQPQWRAVLFKFGPFFMWNSYRV
jgi:hypothetical protein